MKKQVDNGAKDMTIDLHQKGKSVNEITDILMSEYEINIQHEQMIDVVRQVIISNT